MSRHGGDLASNGRLTLKQTLVPLEPEKVQAARLWVAVHAKDKNDYMDLVHTLGMKPGRDEGMEVQVGASTP